MDIRLYYGSYTLGLYPIAKQPISSFNIVSYENERL